LTHEQGIALIDQLTEFGEPYPALLLTGGDPLMREDFFDLIAYAKKLGIYVAVAASVSPKLTQESIKRMKGLDVDIMSLSLDGSTPNTHDKLRGVPGTWIETVRSLKLAREFGLRAQINTTVMRSNIEELPDIFHIAREAGSVAWEVFFLIRTGRGAALESLEPAECEEVMHFLYDASQYGVPVRTAEGPHFRRIRAQREHNEVTPDGPLYEKLRTRLADLEGKPTNPPSLKMTPTRDGKGIVFIAHNGEVHPSGFLPINSGKVPDARLTTIYRTSPLFMSLRDPSRLKGRCGRCEYNTICGGSRSRAFAEFGDPLAEDPACMYIPLSANVTQPIMAT
jgi:radical SAM protein